VQELFSYNGFQWAHADLTVKTNAPPAVKASSLVGYPWPTDNVKQVSYLDGSGQLHELSIVAGQQWEHANLSSIATAPPARAGSALTGYQWTVGSSKQVTYLDDQYHLIELSVEKGKTWKKADPTQDTGAPAAVPGSALSGYQWVVGGSKQVAYFDSAGHVHELSVELGKNWSAADLTQEATAPAAVSGSALSGYEWTAGKSKQVVYLDVEGHVHELFIVKGGQWEHADLTAKTGASGAAKGSALTGYDWVTGASKQVSYLDGVGHLHQLRVAVGGAWGHTDLTAASAAPGAVAGSPLAGYQLVDG
jgi:hypothetical protein